MDYTKYYDLHQTFDDNNKKLINYHDVNEINEDKKVLRNDTDNEDISLKSFSEKDAKWDIKKDNANSFQKVFSNSDLSNHHRYAERISDCAKILNFIYVPNEETGELKLKLKSAPFCHVRHCPICDWRRSLRAQAMFKNAIPKIIENNSNARWIFLTLTIANCPIKELRDTIKIMNNAWAKMIKRKGLSFIKGWARKVEVTQEKNRKDYAHPHFHCILQVNESYFSSRDYLSQKDWIKYWTEAMKSNVDLGVDVRALRKSFDSNDIATTELLKAFNYSVKPEDIIDDRDTTDWFLEYVEQVHSLKFLTSGGTLKNIFKDENESDEDLINVDDEGNEIVDENTNPELLFFFRHSKKQYMKKRD